MSSSAKTDVLNVPGPGEHLHTAARWRERTHSPQLPVRAHPMPVESSLRATVDGGEHPGLTQGWFVYFIFSTWVISKACLTTHHHGAREVPGLCIPSCCVEQGLFHCDVILKRSIVLLAVRPHCSVFQRAQCPGFLPPLAGVAVSHPTPSF